MKIANRSALCAGFLAFVMLAWTARAEDIDIFVRGQAGSANTRPNIVFLIDNSANWSAANQNWPGGIKQGQAELRALRNLVATLGENVNVGLMMFTAGGTNGAYVRFHSRQMTAANKAALRELIGDDTCVDGPNSLNGTPNCIYKNFDGSEKVATGQIDYSAAMFEVFKYFGGYTNPANAQTGVAGSPLAANRFGPLRYSGNPDPKSDPAAYTAGAGRTSHVPPIDATNGCVANYIVFVGNGFPNQDSPASLLSNVGGATTQLLMPTTGGASVAPASNEVRYADEWAKYLFTTDVSDVVGQQNVRVYTLDAYNAQQDQRETRLLMSMAKYGGGRYFAASNETAVLQAFREVMIDIQSVSSVFTAATLPVSSSNRAQLDNQVYFGMFQPDAQSRPRWYGNLKRFQLGIFNGEVRLADKDGVPALAAASGNLQSCAASFWSTDSGTYWDFSPTSAGLCSTVPNSVFSDLPDGPFAEKGGAAQVIRRNNNPPGASYAVNRTIYTCTGVGTCASMVPFNSTNVTQAAVGAATPVEHQNIINHTLGHDVNDENANGNRTEARPSLHGDIVHSRPLPVSYPGATGAVLYYGANDGTFRAISGATGRELWAFVAPEHHAKLKRPMDNLPLIAYPGMPSGITPTPQRKDYFFDGAAGIYQNADSTQTWIFPTMRRGGRMLYALDVSQPLSPAIKWRVGCPNAASDVGCTAGFENIGQTWSAPSVAKVKGYDSGSTPVIIMGAGYDACEDAGSSAPACGGAAVKGRQVFVLDASTGARLAAFSTTRSVAADIALVDRNFDGHVDHAYIADTGGTLYRIDFSSPSTLAPLAAASWTITTVARTQNAGRKFLFAPAVFASKTKVYVAIGSGDREHPTIMDYPYVDDVKNRFYMYVDSFSNGTVVDLDGASMANFTGATLCSSSMRADQTGWYMDLAAGRGEQTVTSPLIYGGLVFFNTNRPLSTSPAGTCGANLGEARGYAMHLLNASGAIGVSGICGGERSGIFTGGGLAPSPVAGQVAINGKPVSVVVGGIQRTGGASSVIEAQRVNIAITPKRKRVFWHRHGDR